MQRQVFRHDGRPGAACQHAPLEAMQDQGLVMDGGLAAFVLDQLRAHGGQPRGGWGLRAELAQPQAQHGIGLGRRQRAQPGEI